MDDRVSRPGVVPMGLVVGVAACLLALLVVPGPASAQRVTVSGTVRGPKGPVADVGVWMANTPTRTDAQGRFTTSFTPAGNFTLSPDQYDLGRMGPAVPPQVTIAPPASRSDVDFTSPGRGNLPWVRLVASDGNPAAFGFGITADSLRTGVTYRAGGGGAGFNGPSEGRLPPDRYRLSVTSGARSGLVATAEVDLTSADAVGLTIAAQVRGDPNAPKVTLARGTVREPAGPVGGAFVFASDGPLVQADAQGRYAYFVSPGQAIVLPVVPPADSGFASDRIGAPPATGEVSGLDVTLGAGSRVAGAVTVPGGAVPTIGFQILATETRTNRRFGLDGAECGATVFPAVPVGTRMVIASAQGFAPARQAVPGVDGQRGRVTLGLSPSGETAAVRGLVVEALAPGVVGPVVVRSGASVLDGDPERGNFSRQALVSVPGVTSRIPGTNLQVVSGPDGTFRIEQAPIGTCIVNSSAQGLQDPQAIVPIRRDADNQLVLTLLRTLGG